MNKGSQDEFFSLLIDALADASKNCQEKGPIVFNSQRPHEADYGISPQNPLCSTSLGGTDAYLHRLRTLDGKKFTWSRGETIYVDCNGAKEVGMDKYQLYLGDKPYKVLYFVPYVGESTEAPHGMRLANDDNEELPVPEAPLDTESASTTAKAPLKVKVKARVVPKTNEPLIQPTQKIVAKEGDKPSEISEQDVIANNSFDAVLQEDVNPHELPVVAEGEPTKTDPKARRKWKPILFFALGVVLAAVITLLVLPKRVIKQDINTINGCPEFYNVEFGMTVDKASELIELKHNAIKGMESSTLFEPNDFMKDSHITLEEDEVFKLYGIKTASVYISFDGAYLDGVMFTFAKDDYSFDKLVKLYLKIYGPATTASTSSVTWTGPQTAIDVYDYETVSEDSKKTIVVRYRRPENYQYTTLSFDGPEYDPCNFLGSNYAFDKRESYYIDNLEKDEDYSYKFYSTGDNSGFAKYTLYPKFEYMGIGKNNTAIAIDCDAHHSTIDVVSYLFLLDKNNAVERMSYIEATLSKEFGAYNSCTYASTKYSELGIVDISFDELKQKVESGTQGIYHVQWISNGKTITLDLTISVNKTYYDGSVAFSI